jgi:hypothetical protein
MRCIKDGENFEIDSFVSRIGLLTNNKEGEVHASVFVSTEFHEQQVPFRSVFSYK